MTFFVSSSKRAASPLKIRDALARWWKAIQQATIISFEMWVARASVARSFGLTSEREWIAWKRSKMSAFSMDGTRLRENQHIPRAINNIVSTRLLVIGCHYFNALLLTVFKLFPLFHTKWKWKKKKKKENAEEIWHESESARSYFGGRVHAFSPRFVPSMIRCSRLGADIDGIRFTIRWNIF